MLPRLWLRTPCLSHLRHQTPRPITTMMNIWLPETEPRIPVIIPSELTEDQLFSFPAFKTWISTLQHSLSLQHKSSHPFHSAPYALREIEVQSVDFLGGDRLGFVKLKATVTNSKQERLPGSVFLRGGSVAMMVRKLLTSIEVQNVNPSFYDRRA